MTAIENPNAANRDGFRETQLLELGIDTAVTHDGRGNVIVTIPVRTLDQMIEEGLAEVDHSDCVTEDELDVANEAGRVEGRKAALREIAEFVRQRGAA